MEALCASIEKLENLPDHQSVFTLAISDLQSRLGMIDY